MRCVILLYVVSAAFRFCSVMQPSTTAASDPPCEISIRAEASSVEAGNPVRIEVKTLGKWDAGVQLLHPWTALNPTAVCEGRPAPLTQFALRVRETEKDAAGSHAGLLLKKDQAVTEVVLLSRWLDMSLPGTYEVVITRNVLHTENNKLVPIEVRSNKLSIKITD